MNGRIFFWSLTSALAGFLFGFDTVVISGAEKTIQALWGLSPELHGRAIASALYGTVVGSLVGGWLADRFGRKATLLWIGVLYFVGAVGSGLAPNVATFIAARVIGGLGIGISTVVAPMYISEIAPPKHRGRLAGMFQKYGADTTPFTNGILPNSPSSNVYCDSSQNTNLSVGL